MKVLHVITGLGAGGAEQQLRLLLRHLPLCCDVVTLTNPGAVAAGIEADGTAVTHLGMNGNRDLSALPRVHVGQDDTAWRLHLKYRLHRLRRRPVEGV